MKQMKVNFDKTTGTIKPMHGVGQPPILWDEYHMFDYLRGAMVPYSRLHDVGGVYGGNRYVDILGVYACAAKGDTACLVIANTNAQDVDVSVEVTNGYEVTKCMLIAENSIWEECAFPVSLPKHSVVCVFYNE